MSRLPLSGPPFVLASKSPSRAALLRGAGLAGVEIAPSGVDEGAIKQAFSGALPDLAVHLARAKACKVSAGRAGALVAGADQILELEGERLDKPADMKEARRLLRRLRGRTHALHGGLVLAQDGAEVWRRRQSARLTMRAFSDDFLDSYLEATGPGILASAGAYALEGLGVHLFSQIDGDYFAILGLPLLPLLEELRRRGALAA